MQHTITVIPSWLLKPHLSVNQDVAKLIGWIFQLLPIPLPIDALNPPVSHLVHILCGKTGMAGLQSGKGCMVMVSVVSAQYINVTDTQTATSL